MSTPFVSVICLTFNQCKHITQTIDSILNQKTDFNIELLIHDDASTDGTGEILKSYEKKYPETVNVMIQEENQFSQGKGFVGIPLCLSKARGKYIAYCEGDDYWCDELKLQKQVDFLELNAEYAVCAHETKIINENYKNLDGLLFSKFNDNFFLKLPQEVYNFEDTLTGNIFHISSIVFRNFPIEFPKWSNKFSALDVILFILIAKNGKIYFINEVMSAYRSNLKSITNSKAEYANAIAFNNMSIHIIRLMNRFFNREYQHLIYPIIARYYVRQAFLYIKKSNRSYSGAKSMIALAAKYNIKSLLKGMAAELYLLIKRRLL